MGSVLFSLSASIIASLRRVRTRPVAYSLVETRLFLFVPRVLGVSADLESSDIRTGLGTLKGTASAAFSSRGALCCF